MTDFLTVNEIANLTGYTPDRLRRSVHKLSVGVKDGRRLILDLGEALSAITEADRVEAFRQPITPIEVLE